MKKNSAIVYCFVGVAVLSVISACQNANIAGGGVGGRTAGDKFRIPLENGDGPTGPGGTPSGGGTWNDVSDWQAYLIAKGTPYTTYLGAGYPSNKFDPSTETATKYFQLVAHNSGQYPKVPYPPNGMVETYTFAASGLSSKYTPVPGPPFSLKAKSAKAKSAKAKATP